MAHEDARRPWPEGTRLEAGASDAPSSARPRAWLAVVGLVLLWGAFFVVGAIVAMVLLLSLALLASADPADRLPGAQALIVGGGLGIVAFGVLLIVASCGVRWAARTVAVLGVLFGLVGATQSGSLGMVAAVGSAVAVVGGALLLLPPSQRWFEAVAARRRARRGR